MIAGAERGRGVVERKLRVALEEHDPLVALADQPFAIRRGLAARDDALDEDVAASRKSLEELAIWKLGGECEQVHDVRRAYGE